MLESRQGRGGAQQRQRLNLLLAVQTSPVIVAGALDQQTSLGLAALGIPGFQMYPGAKGAVSLTTSKALLDFHHYQLS